ncbi:hypothetical protein ODI84_07125 [Pseudomonas putida]|uniref:Uncharacterized protein n=1 Tax=Pseudomonas putida TaxID=303 RepID=A0A1X0ZQ43_PSEPU|nr:hypothetical protein [Pseudomonas putida]MEB3899949.1 hypothetical protein [Pseudomonas putida]ORL61104.1 hypothetical protein B7H17_21200 [Pseudomonas putida]
MIDDDKLKVDVQDEGIDESVPMTAEPEQPAEAELEAPQDSAEPEPEHPEESDEPEHGESEDPVEPEREEPEEPAKLDQSGTLEIIASSVGPIDPLGPLGLRGRVGKEGPDLTNAEHEAFDKVQTHVHFVFQDVLSNHGLDPSGDWLIHIKDDFSERSPAAMFLTWALITGNLQKPALVEYEDHRTGEVLADTDGTFWAALQETFDIMMKVGVIA